MNNLHPIFENIINSNPLFKNNRMEYPNEHRFLTENVYPDCVNAEISVKGTGHYLSKEYEFVIRHEVKGKTITEFTPVKEVEGWPLPEGCGDHFNSTYKLF